MSQILLSPKAKSDLSDIWEYTLAAWGIDQAEKYVRTLWNVITKELQPSFPKNYRRSPPLRAKQRLL